MLRATNARKRAILQRIAEQEKVKIKDMEEEDLIPLGRVGANSHMIVITARKKDIRKAIVLSSRKTNKQER